MSTLIKLLIPGMHIKRWLILLLIGITFISLGIAYLMTQVYRTQPFPEYVGTLTLQFIGRGERGLLFVAVGLITGTFALLQLSRSVLAPFVGPGRDVVDLIRQHRSRGRGPKVVAIGGGTGLSTLLRGMKEYTSNLTAIVSVADDGGSSGRLREDFGMLPPGDVRQCLVALADAEPQMKRLFEYRFTEGKGLEGHSFGNLFIAAMMGTTGKFDEAIRESSRVLAVRGQILPATLANVTLSAEFDDGSIVSGETAIRHAAKRIARLFLQSNRSPDQPNATVDTAPGAVPDAVRAIAEADIIVMGPGSLYTSVLPNLLVEDIARAVRASRATKLYVCNVATELGETDEFRVADHIAAVERHVGPNLFQFVLVNSNLDVALPKNFGSRLVAPNGEEPQPMQYTVVLADVIDRDEPRRHGPKKLAQSILRVHYERGNQESYRTEEPEQLASGV